MLVTCVIFAASAQVDRPRLHHPELGIDSYRYSRAASSDLPLVPQIGPHLKPTDPKFKKGDCVIFRQNGQIRIVTLRVIAHGNHHSCLLRVISWFPTYTYTYTRKQPLTRRCWWRRRLRRFGRPKRIIGCDLVL